MKLRRVLPLLLGGQIAVQAVLATLLLIAFAIGLIPVSMPDKGLQGLQLALACIAALFWWMLTGSRLFGFAHHARQLRMPKALGHLPPALTAGAALVVLLPAAVLAAQGQDLALALAALSTAACLGLFWASMPPWMMFAIIAAGALPRFLPISGASFPGFDPTPAMLGALSLAIAACVALFWARSFRRGAPANPWSMPLALALGSMSVGRNAAAQHHGMTGASLPFFPRRIPRGLRGNPRAALAIALGQGFGRDLRTFATEHAWILAVAAFWLLLYLGNPMEGGARVALVFPGIIVACQMTLPAIRMWTLSRYPGQGLHELALLPGIGIDHEHAADTLARTLLRRQFASLLAVVGLMSAYGWVLDAPVIYHRMLLDIGLLGCLLGIWLGLLCIRGALHGGWLFLILATFWLGALVTMLMTIVGHIGAIPALFLIPGYVGLALLSVHAAVALKRQPHPYLAH